MARHALILAAILVAASSIPAAAQTAEVTARGETAPVGTVNADAADDPAIWRNARQPSKSLIVATDKKAGLYVYGLDGAVKHFAPAGRLNNVDLLDLGKRGIIVVASDRNDLAQAKLRIYRLDPKTAGLTELGSVSGGAGEAYGICLLRSSSGLLAFSVLKEGAIHMVRIDLNGSEVKGDIVRTLRVATQPEGCVVDGRSQTLFVGEEAHGIWAFDIRANSPDTGKLVASVDGVQLVADVEGLALAPKGRRGGWLVASSQGDNAYALYQLPTMQPAGRFRIIAGKFGATEETDGIELASAGFGPTYPRGLLVVQDGINTLGTQNFKLVSWADVLAAMRARSKNVGQR
jgi:3-phytase